MWIIYGRFGESYRYVTYVLTVPYAILHHVVVRYKCISDDMSTFNVAVKQACYCSNSSSSSPDSHFNYNKQCGYHRIGRQWIWIKTYLPWSAGQIDIEVLIMHHVLIMQYVRYKPILIADDRKNPLSLTVLHQVSMLVDTHKDWEIKKTDTKSHSPDQAMAYVFVGNFEKKRLSESNNFSIVAKWVSCWIVRQLTVKNRKS